MEWEPEKFGLGGQHCDWSDFKLLNEHDTQQMCFVHRFI